MQKFKDIAARVALVAGLLIIGSGVLEGVLDLLLKGLGL